MLFTRVARYPLFVILNYIVYTAMHIFTLLRFTAPSSLVFSAEGKSMFYATLFPFVNPMLYSISLLRYIYIMYHHWYSVLRYFTP